MDIVIKILQFFMSLSLLVAIHEFGHYIVARIFKIRVEKFYIFFDPWFSIYKKKIGQTEYGIGWLPLGGYVKIAGMIDESMDKEQMAQPVKPDEFRAKPAWQRLMVMLAGVVMNVILAFFIYTGICYFCGTKYFANEDAKYGYVYNDAGKALGFQDGDLPLAIDGESIVDAKEIREKLLITDTDRTVDVLRDGDTVRLNITFDKLLEMRRSEGYKNLYVVNIPFIIDSIAPHMQSIGLQRGDIVMACNEHRVVSVDKLSGVIEQYANDTVNLVVDRGGEILTLRAPVGADGEIDLTPQRIEFQERRKEYSFAESFPGGAELVGNTMSSYWEQLKLIVNPETKMYEELGGFIAIGSVFPGHWDWENFWYMTAFLSIMLAILNVLPIPGLDGGHALFTLWEILTGRKPSDKFLEIMQYIGLFLLLILLIYANGNDIVRLFN
ncbi:MAG: RIP metalloprotease RseP [Alistipes sp.]|nr:RIP metalloprotease RseP [Alistipes sp.]